MTSATGYQDPPALDPVGAILAFVFPGAGHWFQGDRRRAVLLASGILGLFFGGLLIGGIDSVDSRHDRLWFVGQVLVGPVALATDYVHQHRFKALDPQTKQLRSPSPGEVIDPDSGEWTPGPAGARAPMSKSLGKMNEIGTLYCTIAGMLNLIVIIDAAFPSRRRGGRP
jgi:hypothetical protein